MLRTFALIGLGAAIALSPLTALAQIAPPATSAAPAQHQATAHKPTGSQGSEMRKRHTAARERTMAGAEHMRKMRMHNTHNP